MTFVAGNQMFASKYNAVNAVLRDGSNHFDVICVSGLSVMVDSIKFSFKKTATGPVLTFLMKVPADYQENYETFSTSLTKAVQTVGDMTAKLYTSAKQTELSEYVGLLVTRHPVSLILGDDSSFTSGILMPITVMLNGNILVYFVACTSVMSL